MFLIKIVLDLNTIEEYIYGPVAGSLKAYEKFDTRFLLHLLQRAWGAHA